jgi:hypothetical protein
MVVMRPSTTEGSRSDVDLMYFLVVASAGIDRGASPPSFLGLAGHPVRWRLLSELAQ